MPATDIVSWASFIISILTLIYFWGFWKGGVDTKLNTLWEVYVLDALHDKPNLATRHSPLQITSEGTALIPESVKVALLKWPDCRKRKGIPSYEIVQCLGLPAIRVFADRNEMTVQDTIALFSLYVKKAIEDEVHIKGDNGLPHGKEGMAEK